MTVWYRFLLQVLSGWRITPPYASFYKRNTFNVDLMQIQQLLCLQKSTLNVFFIFSAFMGGQKGPVFYIYYERITGHRSKLKIFAEGGFILPLYFSVYYEGIWRLCLKISPAKQRRRREITRRRKNFVWDGYKRPRFFSIYYEGICRAPLKAPPSIMNKM